MITLVDYASLYTQLFQPFLIECAICSAIGNTISRTYMYVFNMIPFNTKCSIIGIETLYIPVEGIFFGIHKWLLKVNMENIIWSYHQPSLIGEGT